MEHPPARDSAPPPTGTVETRAGQHPHISSRRLFFLYESVAMPITFTRSTFYFAARCREQMRALLNHKQTLAQLAATGGVVWPEMAAIMLDQPVDAHMSDTDAQAACEHATAELADRIAHD